VLKTKTQEEKIAAGSKQKNWYYDRYQSLVVQRNILSIFSLLALIFSTIAIFFVYRNIPIVTVEPFVIQVEPKSGITQVVNASTVQQLTAEKAVNQYFLVKYIRAQESYDGAFPYKFEEVRLFSQPDVFARYAWNVNPNNPQSFLARTNGTGTRDVKIKSISRLDNNRNCMNKLCKVQARVLINEQVKQKVISAHKIIYLEFMYTNINLTINQRYINPIGFRVVKYRVDQEVLQ
jgi:type IV secretion system protein VirB8